jgi:RsiW-degrading membrane proteinase PrsW (M82 family)
MEIILLALAPGLAICLFIYYQDKHDREPTKLLIMSFLLGALSIVPAILATIGIKKIFNLDNTYNAPDLDQLYYAFMAVALSEELSKFIVLRSFAYPKKAFDEPFDGITYSVMISMGFATIENFLYLYYDEGISIGIHRMFTAVPAHASFAVVMGYYVGLSKFSHKNYPQWVGLLAAIILHGLYDACLFLSHYPVLVIISLLIIAISIYYSLKAIKLHQINSPFNRKQN